ncbi:MAG: HD-GYP domain-containing protein [Pseudomonadales bacterium]|nr:HD-GYP domain-containing protein [Pseudomonadales bacterium]
MLRDLDVNHLTVGMYVAELDRPWLETPFTLQGFYIRAPGDIERLGRYCRFVRVDPRRYDIRLANAARAVQGDARSVGGGQRRVGAVAGPEPDPGFDRHTYDDTGEIEQELPTARAAIVDSGMLFQSIWDDFAGRRRVSMTAIAEAVDPLVESILRNKDALVTLLRVRQANRNVHDHCIAMAIWAGLLGRQLGLPPEKVRTLALGCSLVDIGKIRLPREVLERPGPLAEAEYALVQGHVQHSLDMLDELGDVPVAVRDIVRWHHERMDGSGYPDGIAGRAIPMFARIAGVVDAYDAMVGPRSFGAVRSSFEALVELQDRTPAEYQPELVERFARAIGLFPNGSLVELSSGEIGIVSSQNTGARLRPRVMVVLDRDLLPLDRTVIIDLTTADVAALRITRELPAGSHGIDAAEYFL